MLSNRSKIYLIFFFSGISGLIYETVWLRILTRVLGNTVYATSVILAVFMAGLALGSYLLGRYGQKIGNKLAGYAYLEMGVAISAFVLIYIFKILTPVYQ
jgi:spermidine synthase